MDNNDIQELIYRIQGRSENFDALKDPVLHKEWTTGDHSVIVSSFNTFLDSLTAANASTGMTNKIPHFLLHANVDGAHIMVFNTVSSYGNGDWTQIAFGVQLSGSSIIAGSQILYRTHHGNSWSDWSSYVNADEEDITLTAVFYTFFEMCIFYFSFFCSFSFKPINLHPRTNSRRLSSSPRQTPTLPLTTSTSPQRNAHDYYL